MYNVVIMIGESLESNIDKGIELRRFAGDYSTPHIPGADELAAARQQVDDVLTEAANDSGDPAQLLEKLSGALGHGAAIADRYTGLLADTVTAPPLEPNK